MIIENNKTPTIFVLGLLIKNFFIKKEITIIEDNGIKKTEDLQGKAKAKVLLSKKNCNNDKDKDKNPKIKNGIKRRFFLFIKINEVKYNNREKTSL